MKSPGKDRADVTHYRGTIQQQLSHDFQDRALEWRRIFAEGWGTFLLVVVAAGADVVAARSAGAITLGMAVIAPGLMVMVTIYFMGAVSGAHLNPAVTLARAASDTFAGIRPVDTPGFILAQIAAGFVAVLCFRWLAIAQLRPVKEKA